MTSILITGASAGIGRALAKTFAAKGYDLGLAARQTDKLETLRTELLAAHPEKKLRIEIAALDVTQTTDVAPILHDLCTKLDSVDIIVANAGINKFTRVSGDNIDLEAQIIQTNVIGAMATVSAAAQYFSTRNRGHIVGITSLAALMPIPRQAAYCASKAAFSMYLDTARMELQARNIDVTEIQPGFITTDIMPDIEKYPFAVSAAKAAAQMATLIERRKKVGVVPAYPWKILKPLIPLLPATFWRKLV